MSIDENVSCFIKIITILKFVSSFKKIFSRTKKMILKIRKKKDM